MSRERCSAKKNRLHFLWFPYMHYVRDLKREVDGYWASTAQHPGCPWQMKKSKLVGIPKLDLDIASNSG